MIIQHNGMDHIKISQLRVRTALIFGEEALPTLLIEGLVGPRKGLDILEKKNEYIYFLL
jgi:hypothetical protein